MKLSFIMQVYLGEYPGSRANAVDKFHRAVNSFLSQEVKNAELIIVSDGCKLTKELFHKHYEEYPEIKFAYIEKSQDSLMYVKEDSEKYYRGLPREVGRAVATGDWIGYMDADDFLIKDATKKLEDYFALIPLAAQKLNKEIKFLFNNRIIEHENYSAVIKIQQQKHGLVRGVATMESDFFEIDGLPDTWFVRGNHNSFGMGTVFMWHTADFPPTKWEDIKSETVSEDILFANKVLQNPELSKHVSIMQVPYYVRCHYNKVWDV